MPRRVRRVRRSASRRLVASIVFEPRCGTSPQRRAAIHLSIELGCATPIDPRVVGEIIETAEIVARLDAALAGLWSLTVEWSGRLLRLKRCADDRDRRRLHQSDGRGRPRIRDRRPNQCKPKQDTQRKRAERAGFGPERRRAPKCRNLGHFAFGYWAHFHASQDLELPAPAISFVETSHWPRKPSTAKCPFWSSRECPKRVLQTDVRAALQDVSCG